MQLIPGHICSWNRFAELVAIDCMRVTGAASDAVHQLPQSNQGLQMYLCNDAEVTQCTCCKTAPNRSLVQAYLACIAAQMLRTCTI